MNKEIEQEIEFILYLTIPKYYFTKCHLLKANAGQVEITCILDNKLTRHMIIEPQIIRNRLIKEEVTTPTNKSTEGPSYKKLCLL